MSTAKPQDPEAPPIENIDQLNAYLEGGGKPKADWRIGTEHEKFVYCRRTLRPQSYEGETGIGAILKALGERTGWSEIVEDDHVIGLKGEGAAVSLEPGGQFELSGAPVETIHETCLETGRHLAAVKDVAEPMGVAFFGAGFAPFWTRADMPRMPKPRYRIMRDYMPKVGGLGLDMMHRTCTVQVNLDYADESDMTLKFRTSLALQPIATALFANSSLVEGAPSGWASWRANIWTDTDSDRTGLLDFVFEPGFGFERYTNYILDVPMYFLRRNGKYIDAAGQSFRDFLKGRLPAAPGDRPTLSDFEDHLSTAFPEVRLKRFLEMRGADGGPWSRICALPAFWVGLLYDEAALAAAWDLAKTWTQEQRQQLRIDAAHYGLRASVAGRSLKDVALDALEISRLGLRRRARMGDCKPDESGFLDTLEEIARRGETLGENTAKRFLGELGGDRARLLAEMSY
ncbi:MAG: glutamate--cysteine ligase [Parvularculaceae bacterium]